MSQPAHSQAYAGQELHLFEKAVRWKAYWKSQLAAFLAGEVLEVGAGLGANTALLADLPFTRWVCLEPDPGLLEAVRRRLPAAGRHELVPGTLADLAADRRFDSILYADVLEHIQDDAGEVAAAVARLRPGGHLVVLAPAHQRLFTAFDAAIGHHRRYDRRSLRRLLPPGLEQARLRYLDAAGLLASLANRLLLRQLLPSERQLLAWDRLLVPVSRALDPLTGYRLGKSVLGVWRRL